MAKISKKTIHIKGMHCPSCEILITDKFKEMPNVTEVKSDFKKQEAEVYFSGHLNQDIVTKKFSHLDMKLEKGKMKMKMKIMNL